MGVHAGNGCTKANNSQQTGVTNNLNCAGDTRYTVLGTGTDSAGAAFTSAGSGVCAAQFDASGTLRLTLLIVNHFDPRRRHLVGAGIIFGFHSTSFPKTLVFGSGT